MDGKKVFLNVPPSSVIVVDKATYHQILSEETKPAASTLTKLEFAQWLQKRKIRVKIHVKNRVKTLKTLDELMALTRVELAGFANRTNKNPIT